MEDRRYFKFYLFERLASLQIFGYKNLTIRRRTKDYEIQN